MDTVNLSTIHPNPRNPRTITGEAFARLRQSIKRDPQFMPLRPIVVDGDGMILGGNQRYQACLAEGMTEVPADWIVRADGLTPEQRKRFVILDNSPDGISGEWDWDILGADFEIPQLAELGLEAEYPDADILGDADPKIEQADELNKKWRVKLGDLWMLGEHRLLCGDSTSAKNMARLMGDAKATLVFTDPPYGVSIGKKNAMLNTFQKGGRCLASLAADDMKPECLKRVLLAAFTVCRPYLADDCSVFVCSPQGGEPE